MTARKSVKTVKSSRAPQHASGAPAGKHEPEASLPVASETGARGRATSHKEPTRFGGKIRALRRREGLSQVQLAERLGISASYLNLIESNTRPLPASLLIKLAQ